MRILAVDSATSTACAGIMTDEGKIYEQFTDCGLTHSATLMPMIDQIIVQTEPQFVPQTVAVTVGPGSFTGVRIGIATAKGLASGYGCGIVGVSALEALAMNFVGLDENAVICPAFDARCGQVYNTLFMLADGKITRMCEDRALTAQALAEELEALSLPVIVAGDGAQICVDAAPFARLAPTEKRYIRACGVIAACEGKKPLGVNEILPGYLRLSQAEREYKNKE